MSPSYTLRYFDAPGLAETIRVMLILSKSEWTEEHPEWPQAKASQPLGRLPVLVEQNADGSPDFVLCESGTIERYLARNLGFFPSDPKKAALQEQLCDFITDIRVAGSNVRTDPSDSTKEKFNVLKEKFIEILPKALEDNGSSISSQGSGLTYIDLFIYSFFKATIMLTRTRTPEFAEVIMSMATPEVTKVISNVIAEPGLQAHVANDKQIFTFLA